VTATARRAEYAVGSLVTARGREWVVLPESTPDLLVLRPLGGGEDDTAGLLPALEPVEPTAFAPPTPGDLGDQAAAGLLRSALRIGFRSSAGPFRSLASLAVDPRPYQLVPLLMALRQPTTRLLIADDVGIGKTIESGLIAAELLAQGEAGRLAVLCSPSLAEQWQNELRNKFAIDAELVLASTVPRLERGLALGESLFEHYPHVIISTDFIKSPRHRDEFVKHCPDLVIVDEAHTCVTASSIAKRTRQQRFDLLRKIAKSPQRHLLLVTATPHSGKEGAFRDLLGLLDPALQDISLDTEQGRKILAQHLVQRRRGDIRHYLGQDTAFPSDRHSREAPYKLTPEYAKLLDRVLSYARESVKDAEDGTVRQRVRWWSALALLRSLASSPRAAASTLRTRAANLEALDLAEADELGRAYVLDLAYDEPLEATDAAPGADSDPDQAPVRNRLLGFARDAEKLEGAKDAKLTELTKTVKALLADGYDPIVFCRFIPTAEYVAEYLARELNKRVRATTAVAAVTGTLAPTQRLQRIEELATTDGARRHVLVATDCLSEGVNLQDHFNAVVHYDLAWNPIRHEQREGRVDRFGQRADIVRAVTLYGTDNHIDGIVLDTLIRKHQQIRKATGVSVPVPDSSEDVMQAVLEGLLLRGEDTAEQLELDRDVIAAGKDLDREWHSAAEREKKSRSRYAQHTIKEQEVAAELAEMRAALGTSDEVRTFAREALTALRSTVIPSRDGDGFTATTSTLPIGLKSALDAALGDQRTEPLVLHDDPPAPRGQAALQRTDPAIGALARFILDAALDPQLPNWQRPARRAGVVRTTDVKQRTTLLLVRYRFHLALPSRSGERQLVAEDARILGFRGSPAAAKWIDESEAVALLGATAAANIGPEIAEATARRVIDDLDQLVPVIEAKGDELAEQLEQSHRRVRAASDTLKRGLKVTAQKPADILGVYIYLPVASAGGEVSR
jgi:superfamily II DNA or RNA helicase